MYSQSKTKSVEEIVDQSVGEKDDDNVVELNGQRRGRSNFKARLGDADVPENSGKTSEEILNEIVNYGLDRSKYLFEVQEKRIYDEARTL